MGADARRFLEGQVVGLIAKLKENDAKDAFIEYARWTRDRDRKCNLVGKDNVPLQELSSSETCLAEYISEQTAEVAAKLKWEAPPDDPTELARRWAAELDIWPTSDKSM